MQITCNLLALYFVKKIQSKRDDFQNLINHREKQIDTLHKKLPKKHK
jgi:hypothetical protein